MEQGISITVRKETIFTCDQYESTWIDLESVDGKDKTLLAGLIFCHPGNPIKESENNLSDLLTKISKESNGICIIRDINMNSLKLNSSAAIKKYKNMLTSYNLTNLICPPTWVTETSETIIDHFYYSAPNKFINAITIVTDISDHFPLLIPIKRSKIKPKFEAIYRRDLSKIHIHSWI